MRRLVWFTLGFGAACGVGVYLAPGLWGLWAGLGFGLGALVLWLLSRRGKPLAPGAAVCLGLAVGFAWFWVYDGILLRPAREADGTTREIVLTASDYPGETDYGAYVDGVISLSGRRYKVRLYLNGGAAPEPGDRVRVTAQLRLTTDGGSQEPTFHRSSGIFLLAYPQGEAVVERGSRGIGTFPARLRRTVGQKLTELFPEDTAGFARALLLGDRSGLSYRVRNELSLAGISHVVAVSGMHLSILFALVYLLTFRQRVLSAVVGIPVLFLFAAVAGFTPSVTRAALMLSLSLLARLFQKEYDPPTALAFAALCLLAWNPVTAASVSFQLSVGAVAGILCFSGQLQKWLTQRLGKKQRLLRAPAASLSVTLGATVFTLPISACTFGVISLVSPLTNLLTLWAVSLVFYGVMAACALGFVWTAGGRALAWAVSWLIRYILKAAELLAKAPAVFPEENPYAAAWVWFAMALLAVFLLGKCRGKLAFALGLCLTLALSVALGILEPLGERFRVTVLDVGQGQCILLQASGKTYVVDCGGTAGEGAGEKAARRLMSTGTYAIDGLILTHFDKDHISGAGQLLSRLEVGALYIPRWEDEDAEALLAAAGDRVQYVQEDLTLSWEGAELHIFAPLSQTTSNESGLSVLFTAGECDTLITGDMSQKLERSLLETHSLPDIELLVVGHHGSGSSTGYPLLRVLRPEVAAISVGRNSYGHPAAGTLARLMGEGVSIARTDRQGTLIFRG